MVVVIGTQLTRWLPFGIFRSAESTPMYVRYIGNILPPAIFGMLVVYCYRGLPSGTLAEGVPQIVCGICVAVCQLLFKNMCVSILMGTALYIIWMNLPI
ncbi:branched-chain amino acid transporter permease [Phocaeicola plebeius]|uniref:branched-chain amino acid transporter permease n=1 Tax=Phocaeicola plebeius TaxID=310297 RepID=UPI0026F2EE8B|nr:AzlD domain-containing protein [Phocaeicola plebeius]